MSERKKILELFEKQSEFTESRVKSGIEMYRKGCGEITVTDSGGKPVSNAEITVNQTSHEFRFGANLFMLDELESDEKNAAYKKRFSELFNMATLPFYWDATEPEKGRTRYAVNSEKLYRRPPIDLCIEFCEKHGIEPREHALAYEHFFPEWLKDKTVTEIKSAYENRCREIAERYASKIPTIEVTNETNWPDGRTALYNEPDFIEWCFKTAEKYFPSNKLAINDDTHCAWGCPARTSSQYYSYTESNLLKGARIDAVGMQYHMFYRREDEYDNTRPFYDPKNLYAHMDLYARLGKPLQITEVTIPAYSSAAEDEELQAEIIKKLYSIWFSHKNVEQIIYWNLVDGYAAFAPQGDMTAGENYYYGGLLRFDMTPKPAYYAVKNLLEKEWHTEKTLVTQDGTASFKGFYGKYDVTITADGRKIKREINLSSNSKNEFRIEI